MLSVNTNPQAKRASTASCIQRYFQIEGFWLLVYGWYSVQIIYHRCVVIFWLSEPKPSLKASEPYRLEKLKPDYNIKHNIQTIQLIACLECASILQYGRSRLQMEGASWWFNHINSGHTVSTHWLGMLLNGFVSSVSRLRANTKGDLIFDDTQTKPQRAGPTQLT